MNVTNSNSNWRRVNETELLVPVRGMLVLIDTRRPHIHVHDMFDFQEAQKLGFYVHEYTCHYCHKSRTIMANSREDGLLEVQDEDSELGEQLYSEFKIFEEEHIKCPPNTPEGLFFLNAYVSQLKSNHPEEFCPTYRSETDSKDLRTLKTVVN